MNYVTVSPPVLLGARENLNAYAYAGRHRARQNADSISLDIRVIIGVDFTASGGAQITLIRVCPDVATEPASLRGIS